jgi:NADH-quinone oxidoreductase subunit L
MLVPLLSWRWARCFAGIVFKDFFVGHYEALSGGALFTGAENQISRNSTMCRCGSSGRRSLPWCSACAGLLAVLHPLAPTCRSKLAERHQALYRFLLNKWYFDELYDRSSCARRSGSAGSSGSGRRRSSTGSAPTALPRACRTSPAGS